MINFQGICSDFGLLDAVKCQYLMKGVLIIMPHFFQVSTMLFYLSMLPYS